MHMKFSVFSVLFLTLSLQACIIHNTKPKHLVIVGSGTYYAKWQKAILEKCSDQAALITVEIVKRKSKEGYSFTEDDVVNIHKYLVERCSVNSGIVI